MTKWIRYRFCTRKEDYRPIIFNPKYPWWCTGFASSGGVNYDIACIVAYLPKGEDLFKYWDDAFDIDKQECEKITFTSRFPKPDYYNGDRDEYETP